MEEDKRSAEEKYRLLEAEAKKRIEEEEAERQRVISEEKQREAEERQRHEEEQVRIAKQQALVEEERKKKQAEDHNLSASIIEIPSSFAVSNTTTPAGMTCHPLFSSPFLRSFCLILFVTFFFTLTLILFFIIFIY